MSQKIVVVAGATGTQGGSVVRALLASGRYKVRGITRKATSPAAKQLADQGVEIAEASLEDKDSLVKAFKGAYAVYGVTPFGDETETQQGKNIVDACKTNNVSLLVWSSLPNATETSGGKYKNMTHYDRKAAVDQYIKEVQQPAVVIYTGIFVDNFLKYHFMKRAADGNFDVGLPLSAETPVPYTWIEKDLGPSVTAIVDNWDDPKTHKEFEEQQPIAVCSYRINGKETAETISKVTGKQARFTGARATGSGEIDEMFRYQDDGLLYPDATIPPPILMKLGVKFQSFEDFVRSEILPKIDQI